VGNTEALLPSNKSNAAALLLLLLVAPLNKSIEAPSLAPAILPLLPFVLLLF
jgi:hypothetical protein